MRVVQVNLLGDQPVVLVRSTNGGFDGAPAVQGLPGFARLGRVRLAVGNHSMLAAWTRFLGSARVYRSVDGASWQATACSGPVNTDIACDPADASRPYLSMRAAPWVLRSDDQGGTFTPLGAGLEGISGTRALSAPGTRLQLASANGAFDADLDRLHADGFENP